MRNDDPTHLENLRRQLDIPRDAAAALGKETVQIIQAGFYISPTGKRVEIHEQIARSVQGTLTISDGSFEHFTQRADALAGGVDYPFYGWSWIRMVPSAP